MPFISVTRLRIRSIRFLPAFLVHVLRTRRQLRRSPGFRGGSLLVDRAWTFWTLTSWDAQDSMRRYMTGGSHKAAMPHLAHWCDEASVVHWELPDETLPSWNDADKHMRENGRPSKLLHPSPQHATMDYRSPRLTATGSIKPTNMPSDRAS